MFECNTFQNINWTHEDKPGKEGGRPEFVTHSYRLPSFLRAGRDVSVSGCKKNQSLTFFPSRKNMKVGVARIPHSDARVLPIPTSISIFANPAPLLPFCNPFSSEIRSNTGSIILQGEQVSLVKKATTALWDFKKLLKEAGFVMMCIGAVRESVA